MAKKAEEKPPKKEEPVVTAEMLGIKRSRVITTGIKDKRPENVAKEVAKHEKLAEKRVENRIAKAKAEAKMKPIDKRKALLEGRFRAVKNRTRANTYSDANLKAWIEEYDLIKNNPKAWNKITQNGTVNFTPSNKKKRTARDILDAMKLEE